MNRKSVRFGQNFVTSINDINNKIIAKNHQFLGVNNAIKNFERRDNLKGKLGVF